MSRPPPPAIAERAAALDAKYDPDHGDEAAQLYARRFGDCDTCRAAEPGFRRTLDEARERAAKALAPETYPYIIMRQTAHLSGCHHASPGRSGAHPLTEHEFRRRLKWHAHEEGVVRYQGEAVDWDGLTRWAQANTGPQGGRYYRACKSCTPPLP
ncbi:hypothetical protein [Streptomyces sp. NPDC014894]|uniref:hypothetical protein n=1 Tax=Streptomyces sp. NPDC014894 TaxID=3364931 RepID=UPI0036FE8BA5